MNRSDIIDRLPRLLEITVVVLLAWMVVGWLLPASNTYIEHMGSAPVSTTAHQEDDVIDSVPLFGKEATPDSTEKAQAVPSHLDIKLVGTVVAGKLSSAIVAIPSEPHQKVVMVGEKILPGITLEQVLPSAIMIKHNGRLERINLKKNENIIISSPSHVGTGVSISTTRREISHAELSNQLQNFPKLMSQARISPSLGRGKYNGYMITNIIPGSLYSLAGLKNGDIIRRVNGKMIKTPRQAMAMYQVLHNASSINLEIVRHGHLREIHYDIH